MRTVVAVWATLLAVQSAAAGPLVALQNDVLRVAWDVRSAALVSLEDKATGRQWLDPAVVTPAYRIQLVGEKAAFSSPAATSVNVSQKAATVVIECTHDKPLPLSVTCTYRLEDHSPYLLGRIALRASAPCRIAEVRFPLATLRLPFGGNAEDDRILWPECDGTLLTNPSVNWPDRKLLYPGTASVQMMAAFDPAAGVLLAARDHEAHTKTFNTRRSGKGVELSIGHLLPQTPVTRWELEYDVALAGLRPAAGFKHITWEAAADLYRLWAVGQPWCRTTLAQRVAAGDVPRWLTQPSLFYAFSLRGQAPDGKWINRLSMVPQQAEAWRGVIGSPLTFMLMSWEKRDSWFTPDYFPPFGGEEDFRRATAQLHEQGHHTLVFLSGLKWTLRKEVPAKLLPSTVLDDEEAFNRSGRPFAISDASGEAVLYGEPTRDVGRHAQICSATPLAREILLGSSLGCQKLGIDCVQADQIVGGGQPACYHPQHGHPAGGGQWCSQALYEHFAVIRREGKARQRDFAFSMEEPGEFFIPALDTYHARDYQQGRWPRSGAGVLGVPLFSYVYHEYLHGYGGDSCGVSERPSDLAVYQQGMNLVCGQNAAVAVWNRWFDPSAVDAVQRRLLRGHLDLWRGPAGEFLNFGRRVASPELDVSPLMLTFTEKDGKAKHSLSVPSVLHSAWRLADGRSATVFACVYNKPVDFTFDTRKFTLQPGETLFLEGHGLR